MPSPPLRTLLENHQIPIYFSAVLLALILAWQVPATQVLSVAINPLIALMLFVTFVQVPVHTLRQAATDLRFAAALLTANFVLVPLLVAGLLPWVPGDPLIRLGFLLVMLTPCVDYVVTFAHLGRADARALLASTPLLLAGQLLLLPLYLGVFLGPEARAQVRWEPFAHTFVWLIAVPLALAIGCQAWAARHAAGARATAWLSMLPVPATAVVLAVVVAAVTPELGPAWPVVRQVAPLYVVFAVLAPLLGWAAARAWRLPPAQQRATAFSAATRNSLVVLPLGLALPGALPLVPAVIITQTLVELLAELAYVKLARRQQPQHAA